jgi:hypothetical protein
LHLLLCLSILGWIQFDATKACLKEMTIWWWLQVQ